MILYDYYSEIKGATLYDHLQNNGVDMVLVNGNWIDYRGVKSITEINQLMELYNPWPAERHKKWLEIQESFKLALDSLVAGTLETERNSWTIQETEARAWKADPNTPVPALLTLSNARGVPLAVLVDKVIAKSDLYKQYYFYFQGIRDRLEDQIKSFTDDQPLERLAELRSLKYEVA